VDHETFITMVEQAIGGGPEAAEAAIHATLPTLGERIDQGEARELAARLPPEDAPWLATPTPAEAFDIDEFVARVCEREGVDAATAQRHIAAVFRALERAAPDEWPDVVAELPRDFAGLLPRGPDVRVVDAQTFLQDVAARAGLGVDAARTATDAVLETLAERIAGGEVDDLITRLPVELHAPLERGRAAAGGRATRMDLERFLRRVAEREGASGPEAVRDARAVFGALRDAVGDEEFVDVTVQLPDEYQALAR
jgi:uncharacterized protein (DUF2267 family)